MLLNHGYLMKYQTWKLLFVVIALDRNRHGGGTLILLTWEVILKESNEPKMLSLSIKLPNKVEKFCISTLYCPLSTSSKLF